MKIESSERVVYQRNPLAEVICQLRFADIGEITDEKRDGFASAMRELGYPTLSIDTSVSLKQELMAKIIQGDFGIQPFEQKITYHFQNDLGYRVSLERGFLALTCTSYTQWNDFSTHLQTVAKRFTKFFDGVELERLGLRYKDVIEREELGLGDIPWHELISAFLLGPLAANALADSQMVVESNVASFLSQTLLTLDNSSVLLQSSLLTSVDKQKRAFMIDADFFLKDELDSRLLENHEKLDQQLNTLHADSGNLFRRGITERLHDALQSA
jgi:uncharacterized protein (TIGR04255 family)